MRTVDQLVAAQADLRPDAVAVDGPGRPPVTYASLDTQAGRVAAGLAARGIGPGDTVALTASRQVSTIVALLGILRAGAAYLALDAQLPAEQRERIRRDAGATVSLDDAACVELCGHDPGPTAGRRSAAHPSGTAYVAYTSGSTGRPKGVRIPHRAVWRLVHRPTYVQVGPGDAVLHAAPLAFDASTFEIWAPLAAGARIVLPPAGALSLADLAQVIREHRVTIAWFTAGVFHQMVDTQIEALAGLRYLLAGGDVLSAAHTDRVLAELPGVRLVNGYGPTENTTFTCCHRVTDPVGTGPVPIGPPIDGTTTYILDGRLRPVPDGHIGELYTGGEGVATGYARRPGATARRFLADPFARSAGARMYRTGDLARRRPDGTLEFHGRVDRQVKISGFRVEPEAVEAALVAADGVRDAAVVATPSVTGTRRLIAFVVLDPILPASLLALRRTLREQMPAYAVPSSLVPVDRLPLTGNGKVDRAALVARPVCQERNVTAPYVAPRTPVEEALATLWMDLLEVSSVGVDDDFYELGGYSLVSMQITNEVADSFGVAVAPRSFYENPTVAGLARLVERASTVVERGSTVAERGSTVVERGSIPAERT
ncbi:non-ribosomal peptide synthetase [Solwaraspora sp. WMMD406]|uniref:non-ribosomal peptide synthetase n=1 Tax=Solwaraspora sp. WMMD406 TaxID=3016095 RepID=UPI0024181229|nr:non-ribosomal peptide synthetase [Solwaraspora sp. WMMD406]MDG4765805.1 non-ribosomal peptide synthetase [Solwaraspora sp. WMMD406]